MGGKQAMLSGVDMLPVDDTIRPDRRAAAQCVRIEAADDLVCVRDVGPQRTLAVENDGARGASPGPYPRRCATVRAINRSERRTIARTDGCGGVHVDGSACEVSLAEHDATGGALPADRVPHRRVLERQAVERIDPGPVAVVVLALAEDRVDERAGQ